MTTDLHLIVVPLQLSTQLLELLLQPHSLAQLGAVGIPLLLQSVPTPLVLLVLLVEASHIRQELARAFGEVINLLHVVHLGYLLEQVTIRSLNLALYRPSISMRS